MELEPRLAVLDVDGYELDDAEAIHREHPDTFWIPDREARESLEPDRIVKLIFGTGLPGDAGEPRLEVERMWVIVKDRSGGFYLGELDNQPYCTDDMEPGWPVVFEPRHVITIYEE